MRTDIEAICIMENYHLKKIPLLIALFFQIGVVSATPYSTENIKNLFNKIGNFNPNNNAHKEVVDTSRALCGKIYTDIISTLKTSTAIESNENIQSTFLYAVEKAGVCTYNAYYKNAYYKTLELYGSAAQHYAPSQTKTNEISQEKSERLATAACSAIKSNLIERTTSAPQKTEEIPNSIFEYRIYCMALLGQHSGIGSAVETYNLSTD
jgi:hypothetical protein